MIKFITIITFLCCTLFLGCEKKSERELAGLKKEVVTTEQEFALMANEQGIEKAFLYFADDSAVINRHNKIYKGKVGIKEFFKSQKNQNAILTWKPDYVFVSETGDLAYTYGQYTYSAEDSSGKVESTGIFHTVWKKQTNGTWRFVWD